MIIKYLKILPLFAILFVASIIFLGTNKAHAALAGDDGPVIIVNNPVEYPSTVETMNPDGSDLVTAASVTESYINSATISKPNSDGDYNIVYSTQSNEGNAVINNVNVDISRNPITPEPTTTPITLESLNSDSSFGNWVPELSYSPDSQNVLALQVGCEIETNCLTDYEFNYRTENVITALKKVNIINQTEETIVPESNDPLLNGGYGQNGAVYFSKSNCAWDDECQTYQSDIWYIPSGSTYESAIQLTNTPDVSEYYIDSSSNNTQLLVVDVNSESCYYAFDNIFSSFFGIIYAGQCSYYYINLPTGNATPLNGINSMFVPKYFSPSNEYIIGTLFPYALEDVYYLTDFTPMGFVDPFRAATAIVSRNDLSNIVLISNQIGIQEWAPLEVIAQSTVTNPTVSTVVSGPTLPKTGTNELLVLAYATLILVIASVVSIKCLTNLKK